MKHKLHKKVKFPVGVDAKYSLMNNLFIKNLYKLINISKYLTIFTVTTVYVSFFRLCTF